MGLTAGVPVNGGIGGTNRSGAVPVYMARMLAKLNIPWHEVPISSRSREFSPASSFTACVHEVALGNADICFGNFWATASRRSISSFTSLLYNDKFHVFVKRGRSRPSFWEALLRPFEPFSATLWVVIFVVLAYVGVTQVYEERMWASHELTDDEDADSKDSFLGKVPSAALRGINAFNLSEVPGLEPTTLGAWLTTFALGFTTMVLVTGYTAVVTTTLMQQSAVQINNLEDAIRQGARVCAHTVVVDQVVARYPKLSPLIVPRYQTDTLSELEKMDAGLCDCAIIWDVCGPVSNPHLWLCMLGCELFLLYCPPVGAAIATRAHRTCGLPSALATLTIATPRSGRLRQLSRSRTRCP